MNFHGGQFNKKNILDFSVNIPTLPYDPAYKNLLLHTIDKLTEYPEIDGSHARMLLSHYLNWPSEQIVLGNGATDLIYLVTRALKLPSAMILQPTFTEYSRALKLSDSVVIDYVMKDIASGNQATFEVDADDLAMAINSSGCRALFICNPNNPTGQLFSPEFIKNLLGQVNQSDFLLVIDESFIEFKKRKEHHEAMKSLMERYNILVIRSMTKTFCVPGLRIGYVFGRGETIAQINRHRDPWALNRFALESIPYFLKNKDHLARLQRWCESESQFLKNALSEIKGITVYETDANYILIKGDHPIPLDFHEALILKGIYLRPCADFCGLDDHYFRIAVKDRASNEKLINCIREVI